MKTLKILFALCFFLGFSTNAVKAQAEVINDTFYGTHWFPCAEESASGYVTIRSVGNANKFYLSISGKLTGDETGNVYLFKDTQEWSGIYNKNNMQLIESYMATVMVHCNGKPFARLNGKVHVTFNASGEWVVANVQWSDLECL